MKLAILTQYYPPEIGAPQRRLSSLAGHFVQAGHEVEVLAAMPNYPLGRIYDGYGGVLRHETRDGVRVTRTFIYPTQRTSFTHRLANYFSFVASSAVAGTVSLGHPDYLMVESPPLFLGLSGMWLRRVRHTRVIFNVSDLWPETAVRLGVVREGSIIHRVSTWLERRCYRDAWLVTGQSKEIVAGIEAVAPGTRTYHLSNGVDSSEFGAERATSDARRTLGDGRCITLYAGLHGIAQGLNQILDVAAALQGEDGPDFVFLGDGPKKAELQQAAKDRGLEHVRFLDARPSNELAPLLAAADILVVPLGYAIPGAVPSKLYEAMASAKPIVLVAGGEPASIVESSGAGLVVPPGDTPGLAGALRRLRDDPALRDELGSNGRRAACQLYDRTAIARRFISYLENGLQE